ncbi:ornithine cyclodeaminase family protein [Duganella sp. Root1480D1]|uniref:ornithine cyclodeaminase family protein n=1 Tax=Duganella sp. Root1480D1 TaxID=1736471 RepID=UPI00070C821C|nr:ornithine cyclodeaminase family protein [Duganella sp. Root1480D1]KQZ43441.1 ornithine cyclodeaminase [Duganella sp. Root1480D1]
MQNNDARLLILDRDAVAALLQPDNVRAAVREAFALHAARAARVFPLVREELPGSAVFGIKSGDVPSQELLGFKAAGFWPANREAGGDAHQATIMLIDPRTGRPLCIADGNAVTTARTAAAGALGIELLARADSEQLCVFGTGVQARGHVDYALHALPSLKRLRYITSDGRHAPEFEALFAGRCEVAPAGGARTAAADAAVAASDVIITATPGHSMLFSADAVRAGTHVNAVGADTQGKRELPAGLLERARVWADDLPQARHIGELQWAGELPAAELGQLLAGAGTAPRSAGDITIFDMTGIALQDLTTVRMLYQRALANNIGQDIAWPW